MPKILLLVEAGSETAGDDTTFGIDFVSELLSQYGYIVTEFECLESSFAEKSAEENHVQ